MFIHHNEVTSVTSAGEKVHLYFFTIQLADPEQE